MKLYLFPGACSLSPHIVFREAGLNVELEKVNIGEKRTASGADFRVINPKGAVPALQLDDGQVLTEGSVIVQYLADRKPESKLAPPAGTLERYRLQEWLNYIASDIHKNFSPLFNPKVPDEYKAMAKELLASKFEFVNKNLEGKDYLMGKFTVADAYLFTVLSWTKHLQMDMSKWPMLQAFLTRVAARPAVHAALEAEGLLKN